MLKRKLQKVCGRGILGKEFHAWSGCVRLNISVTGVLKISFAINSVLYVKLNLNFILSAERTIFIDNWSALNKKTVNKGFSLPFLPKLWKAPPDISSCVDAGDLQIKLMRSG